MAGIAPYTPPTIPKLSDYIVGNPSGNIVSSTFGGGGLSVPNLNLNPALAAPAATVASSANNANATLGAADINAAGGLANTVTQGQTSRDVAGIQNTGTANVANIQGLTARDVANIQNTGNFLTEQQRGQDTLAATGLGGQYTVAGQDIAARAGIEEAQTAALPGLINSAIQAQKFNAIFPIQKQLLGQVGNLLGDAGNFLGGGGSFLNPTLPQYSTGGGLTTAQGANVPSSVINPRQAQTLIGQGATQGNVGTANQYANAAQGIQQAGGGASSPLMDQLAQQLSAQNNAALQNAATQFRGALAPANAQQGLGAAQLAELVRSNQAKERLGLLGEQTKRYGGLFDAITGLANGGLRLGGQA